MARDRPLVSVGVPTYDRARSLERTLRSVLEQDHERLEVLVSDNASTDGTEELCRGLAAADDRLRYVRHPVNRGPTDNFNAVLAGARGEYRMWLGDDDWLDPDYVARCVEVLEDSPEHALACGRARYFRGEEAVLEGRVLTLEDPSPARRLRTFYAEVGDNAAFYGLMPRAVFERVTPLRKVIGADWLVMAAVAFSGRVRTLEETRVHRSLGGASESSARAAQAAGIPRRQAVRPHLVTALYAFEEILWSSPVYASLPLARRLPLAVDCLLRVSAHELYYLSLDPRTRGLYDALRWLYHRRRGPVGRR
jgi:glycosyltransferase involved in cell wall biosynthesis